MDIRSVRTQIWLKKEVSAEFSCRLLTLQSPCSSAHLNAARLLEEFGIPCCSLVDHIKHRIGCSPENQDAKSRPQCGSVLILNQTNGWSKCCCCIVVETTMH